jgi:hypothetical protein
MIKKEEENLWRVGAKRQKSMGTFFAALSNHP